MKKSVTLLIIAAVFVMLLAGASVLYRHLGERVELDQMVVHEAAAPTVHPEETAAPAATDIPAATEVPAAPIAPDFTAYNSEGEAVSLGQFFGKPIVLNFWASWCGPCQSEMPDFQQKYTELGEEIQFLMVNMTDGNRETVDVARTFIEQKGYTFPVLYDSDMQAAVTYAVYSLPTTYFIDADGQLIAQAIGAINQATLQRGIDMIAE